MVHKLHIGKQAAAFVITLMLYLIPLVLYTYNIISEAHYLVYTMLLTLIAVGIPAIYVLAVEVRIRFNRQRSKSHT